MPGPSLLVTGLISLALGVGANLTSHLTASTNNFTAHPACVFDDDCRHFSARAVCFIYFCVDWDKEELLTKCSNGNSDVCKSNERCKKVRRTRSGTQGICFGGKACSGHSNCSLEEPYCMMEEHMEGGFCGPQQYYTARQQDCKENSNFCKEALLGDHCCLDFSRENSTRCCSHPLKLVMPGQGDEAGFKRLESALKDSEISEDDKKKICEVEEPEELVKRGLASCLQFTSTTSTTTTTTTTSVKPSTATTEKEVRPVDDGEPDLGRVNAVMPLKGSATSRSHGGSVILAFLSASLIVFHL